MQIEVSSVRWRRPHTRYRRVQRAPDTPHTTSESLHPAERRLRALFRSRLGELLRTHPGEWALIDDSGDMETDVDKLRLLNRHHPANPGYFIIRRIVLGEGQ